jgi:hypothetical protein
VENSTAARPQLFAKEDVLRDKGGERMETKLRNLLPKMMPGAVCAQMVRCGKPNCRCAAGELHGPYHYHFSRTGGVLVKQYVRARDVETVRAACIALRTREKQERELLRRNMRQLSTLVELVRDGERSVSEIRANLVV